MHDAKSRLSQLVEKAANGESVVIAKAGKPVARVVAIDSTHDKIPRRTGFLAGHIEVPDDFDQLGDSEIEQLFGLTNDGQESFKKPSYPEPGSEKPARGKSQ